ncbi:MAG: hypothetical protein KAJ10_11885 [Thermodesulfovibrionia bacterium]|nr:hypothetical protein [Thermodesulfovibrionia bacterium]
MTTVINYNFFGPNPDSIFGDLGFKNRSSDKKQNHSPREERTIDITAQSRVLDDDEGIEINLDKPRFIERLADPAMSYITYDRRGKIVRHYDSTGMHVSRRVL